MRSSSLAFGDALRLLGVGDDPAVARLGKVAGLAAGAVTVASVGTVDFFAFRDEAVRWGNAIAGSVREGTRGLSRFDRTERLVAAHSVIVLTAFYEAIDEVLAEVPGFDLADARLSAAEQVGLLSGQGPPQEYVELVDLLLTAAPPMPAPHLSFEETCAALEVFYTDHTGRLHRFLYELAAFEAAPDALRVLNVRADSPLPARAVEKYVEAYRQLVAQAPEFAAWAGSVDAQVTRLTLRLAASDLARQLVDLQAGLHETLDATRKGLINRYGAPLAKSILSSADAPSHLTLPTLEQGYISPRGRLAFAGEQDLPAAESWWQDRDVVDDVREMLLGHVTAPLATSGPLVVLGQPGSGKSVLTRVLAAVLSRADFLVVRVELRNVHADATPQAQIESAIHQLIGERVSWPELVRRAGTALPVVMMDGFDELLQATGVHRADYFEQLAEFQQREAELGRPVAVLVTSRTVVADRARFPSNTPVVRLEPFDDDQVQQWLDVWNGLNERELTKRSLRTLSAQTAMRYGELGRQPLLLLLLALYDASNNDLRRSAASLGRLELYERLFQDFIKREVEKHHQGDSSERREQEMDAEWRRLGAVALAMLNRGSDVISERDLDVDLPHLLDEADLVPPARDTMSRALTPGQRLVGRFYFVHESQVSRDTGTVERTFEFLHATFGEFLAAKHIVAALKDLADDRLTRRKRPQSMLDAGYLFAVTSFVTITRRAPLFEFSQGMLDQLDADTRRSCRELALELFPEAGFPHPRWSLPEYEPQRKPVAARHAAFAANLVCFVVLLSDKPVDVAEIVGEPVLDNWRQHALLWQSQLESEDRKRLWQMLRVAWRLDTDPTRLEVRVEDGGPISMYQSLPWPPDVPPATVRGDPEAAMAPDVSTPADSRLGRSLRLSAFVQTAHDVRECLYDLMPYWREVGIPDLHEIEGEPFLVSEAALFLQLLLAPATAQSSDVRAKQYLYCLALTASPRQRYLLIRQLADDASSFSVAQLEKIFPGLRSSDLLRNREDVLRVLRDETIARNTVEDLLLSVAWDFSDDEDDPVRQNLLDMHLTLQLSDPFAIDPR